MSYLTAQQIASMSTSELVTHYGVGFSIEICRSIHNDVPMIVFRSTSRGLVTVLGTHHANKLSKMQPAWKPWTSGSRADKTTSGYFYNVISLKGLRSSTLRRWVDAALSLNFAISIDDGILPQATPTITVDDSDVWEQPIGVEVVDTIPAGTRAVVAHKPFGLPGRVATCDELRKVLRAQGKLTTGNKAALLARL